MNIADSIRVEDVHIVDRPVSKDDCLHFIAECAAQAPATNAIAAEDLFNALQEREKLGSTGFGNGIAIPHCHLSGIDHFTLGIVSVPQGVDFDSLDGQKTFILAYIVAPAQRRSDHIRILSGVSRALSLPNVIEEMTAAKTREALFESFIRHTTDTVKPAGKERVSIQIIIQEEKFFQPVLQIFSSNDAMSAIVVDGKNMRQYLQRLPVFSNFWTDSPSSFCKIIMAIVHKKLMNETIRQIEAVTGGLDKATGITITAQEVLYSAGQLDV